MELSWTSFFTRHMFKSRSIKQVQSLINQSIYLPHIYFPFHYKIPLHILYCYIVSVKVQFFCLPIGQNRVTCRSTKRHVRQPVRNQTFIDRSIIKWVQYACVSTMKFQSSFLKLFTKHLRRSIYPVLVSN
jgi:hypothetical protein